MKKLFIIGNGFDIAHKLPTRYSDFQKYLKDNYPEASDECLTVPSSFTMPDGDVWYNDDEVVGFLLRIITESEGTGEEWNDLEHTLGYLNFDDIFDCYENDDDDDDSEWHKTYNNEDTALNVLETMKMIKRYFSDWIKTIDVCSAKSKDNFKNLIDTENDLFLSFNYTETLECLYKTKNVYHIHGKQGSELVFGHGNDKDYYEYYSERYLGAENHLSTLQSVLRKDTKSIIKNNENLFELLGKVDAIYSYGFSFSDVDMAYIKKLCEVSNTENIVWYFNDYDRDKLDVYKKKLNDCGFKGKFEIFSI